MYKMTIQNKTKYINLSGRKIGAFPSLLDNRVTTFNLICYIWCPLSNVLLRHINICIHLNLTVINNNFNLYTLFKFVSLKAGRI